MKFLRGTHARVLLVSAMLALASCAGVPTRETPLQQIVPLTAPVLAPGVEANSDKLFVVVTFSGGGKRAAAFSYGVLEALRSVNVITPDGEQHRLLDEIDIISAVSGSAFTAAYYSLHGHETFGSFVPQFLNHDTEKDLWNKVLKPSSWGRLADDLVSRSDLEVEYFDRQLFNGATVHDVMTRSPRVIISATDLVRAKPFAFTREQLNSVCVDPKSVPVARAVFASAATPEVVISAPIIEGDATVAAMNLNKSGRGVLNLTNTATYGGTTTINGQGGTLALSGAGALVGVTGITVNAEGVLKLDNTAANNNNRVNNTAAITLTGGTLWFLGNGATAQEACMAARFDGD